ncbi:hypothetical protein evm_002372 [Chilo suppressalis]|nr:hypothetical protein evm_002372 [Chilo suppressalis]
MMNENQNWSKIDPEDSDEVRNGFDCSRSQLPLTTRARGAERGAASGDAPRAPLYKDAALRLRPHRPQGPPRRPRGVRTSACLTGIGTWLIAAPPTRAPTRTPARPAPPPPVPAAAPAATRILQDPCLLRAHVAHRDSAAPPRGAARAVAAHGIARHHPIAAHVPQPGLRPRPRRHRAPGACKATSMRPSHQDSPPRHRGGDIAGPCLLSVPTAHQDSASPPRPRRRGRALRSGCKQGYARHHAMRAATMPTDSPRPAPRTAPRCARAYKAVEGGSEAWAGHWARHWERDARPYRCALCEKAFRDPHQILKHGMTHKAGEDAQEKPLNKRFVCDFCPEGFVYMRKRDDADFFFFVCQVPQRVAAVLLRLVRSRVRGQGPPVYASQNHLHLAARMFEALVSLAPATADGTRTRTLCYPGECTDQLCYHGPDDRVEILLAIPKLQGCFFFQMFNTCKSIHFTLPCSLRMAGRISTRSSGPR